MNLGKYSTLPIIGFRLESNVSETADLFLSAAISAGPLSGRTHRPESLYPLRAAPSLAGTSLKNKMSRTNQHLPGLVDDKNG